MKQVTQKSFNFDNILLVIGLGNPGPSYTHTRHNIGFRILDSLADTLDITLASSGNAEYGTGIVTTSGNVNRKITLLKPLTYMNASGEALKKFYGQSIKSENILVLHDELEKPFSHISITYDGSHKGHNGLKSLISVIGPEFWRLKFGISRPADKSEVATYVLAKFTPSEEAHIPLLIQTALKNILHNS